MSSFRTEIFPDRSEIRINYNSPVLLLGSCFAQNIGDFLNKSCFPVCTNPFGVLYNPFTIANSIDILLSDKKYTESDLGFHNQLWYSFDHYTGFSDPDRQICLDNINAELDKARNMILSTKILIITLGTSWVYRFIKDNRIVANCHKIPAKEFDRFFADSKDIVNILEPVLKKLKAGRPDLKIIFTVSPIRHWKDGAAGNQLSKANLIVAVHELISKMQDVAYFPSYEIMMDDLRDYRFYAEDMLHPNKTAVDYIWKKFMETHIDEECYPAMTNIEKLNNALNHRPFNPNSKDYIDFIKKNIEIGEKLQKESGIDVGRILNELNNKIN